MVKRVKNTSKRASRRQREILQLIAEGSEDWAQVWTRYETVHANSHLHHFDRVTSSLVRHGLVDDTGEVLAITDAGMRSVDRYGEDGTLSSFGRALITSGRWSGTMGENAPDLAPWNEP